MDPGDAERRDEIDGYFTPESEVAAYLSPDGHTLAVDGCHWACPYEYRFFDFTDPARG